MNMYHNMNLLCSYLGIPMFVVKCGVPSYSKYTAVRNEVSDIARLSPDIVIDYVGDTDPCFF